MNLQLVQVKFRLALHMGYKLPHASSLTEPQRVYLAHAALISRRQRDAIERRHGIQLFHAQYLAVHTLASPN